MSRFKGSMTWAKFAILYSAIIVVGVTAAVLGSRYLHIDGIAIVFAGGAVLFFLAATRTSETLFLVVRNAGWFSAIESDRAIRIVLVVFSILLAIGASLLVRAPHGAG
jgi:ABC-type polysaccharide/polyol phosphate export permease